MDYKIKKSEGSLVRLTLVALVTDDVVLESLEPHYSPDLFQGEGPRLIAQWCVNHFRKFHKAPRARITHYFSEWAEKAPSSDVANAVERLLEHVSRYFETNEFDTNFLLDGVERYVQGVQKDLLAEKLQDVSGNSDEVHRLLERYAPLQLTRVEGVLSLSGDLSHIVNANDRIHEPLITFDGDLGHFFGDTFRRGAFVAFQAAEKTGKSFWLQELFFRCTKSTTRRWKCLYFECGDLTEGEWFDRLASRVSGRPLKPVDELSVPVRVHGDATVEHRVKNVSVLEKRDKIKALNKFAKRSRGMARFVQTPAGQLSVPEMRNLLKRLARNESWTPDVIIVDYADILSHRSLGEGRDGINGSWMALRALAMEFDCCVVTATQADAASYGRLRQTRSNFSDDKRKYAHVTGAIGLNQCSVIDGIPSTGDVFLLQWLARRHGRPTRDVFVAGVLDVCRPVVTSSFVDLQRSGEEKQLRRRLPRRGDDNGR